MTIRLTSPGSLKMKSASASASTHAKPPNRLVAGALRFAHFLGLPDRGAKTSGLVAVPKHIRPHAHRAADSKRHPITDGSQAASRSSTTHPPVPTRTELGALAVAKERARCGAIFRHGLQIGLATEAYRLTFETELRCTQAIALLDAAVLDRPARGRLAQRMEEISTPNVGPGDGMPGPDPATPRGVAQAILAAGEKARKGSH
ncbi:hypothetical protein E5CHR_02611 [Variovorax sp. PBL-E5]|nr:hypothetical protein E5CHR_02611 [Variovorax sp. PBL-E5]